MPRPAPLPSGLARGHSNPRPSSRLLEPRRSSAIANSVLWPSSRFLVGMAEIPLLPRPDQPSDAAAVRNLGEPARNPSSTPRQAKPHNRLERLPPALMARMLIQGLPNGPRRRRRTSLVVEPLIVSLSLKRTTTLRANPRPIGHSRPGSRPKSATIAPLWRFEAGLKTTQHSGHVFTPKPQIGMF